MHASVDKILRTCKRGVTEKEKSGKWSMKHPYVQNGISVWSRSVGARLLDEWAAMMDVVDGGCPICVCNVQQFLPAFAVLKGRVCLSDACSPGAAHILFSECQHTDTHTHFYLIKSSDILYSALPTARLGSVLY